MADRVVSKSRRVKTLAIGAAVAVVVATLIAFTAPFVVPLLPQQVQVTLGGTIDTTPGTVDDLFTATELGDYRPESGVTMTHQIADEEYVRAATIWPWALPPGWSFPKNRGIRDVPGRHWAGMGVQAAFSLWAHASLTAVDTGNLDPSTANALLDEVENATRTLLEVGVLSDQSFIDKSVTPLRP